MLARNETIFKWVLYAAATVLFLLVLAEPMLEKLDRIKTKYGLVE